MLIFRAPVNFNVCTFVQIWKQLRVFINKSNIFRRNVDCYNVLFFCFIVERWKMEQLSFYYSKSRQKLKSRCRVVFIPLKPLNHDDYLHVNYLSMCIFSSMSSQFFEQLACQQSEQRA